MGVLWRQGAAEGCVPRPAFLDSMPSELPTITIITPTLNAARTLGLCLQSIRAQDYPQDRIEILLADGGSTDETAAVGRRYGVDRILPNPLKTAEAGKAVAVDSARNDILAFIDSDNLLDGPDWLRRMVAPFSDPDIVASEPLEYSYRRSDPPITRYCALMGMNDPLCYFLGNYDRINRISGRWTGLPVPQEDRGDYLKVSLNERCIPTIGANGFLVRKVPFLRTEYKPYLFDIDVVYDLIRDGNRQFAKVRIGIVHLFAGEVGAFARKQQRRVGDYLFYDRQKLRRYPWGAISRVRLVWFVLCTVLVFPLLVQAARGMARTFDTAWLFHVRACWVTLTVYGWGVLKGKVLGLTAETDRTGWSQAGGPGEDVQRGGR